MKSQLGLANVNVITLYLLLFLLCVEIPLPFLSNRQMDLGIMNIELLNTKGLQESENVKIKQH